MMTICNFSKLGEMGFSPPSVGRKSIPHPEKVKLQQIHSLFINQDIGIN